MTQSIEVEENPARAARFLTENKGIGLVIGCEGLASFWLPAPTGGYVTFHHSPSVGTPSNTWCMGVYFVPAGGVIPARCYMRTTGYYSVVAGQAELVLEGKTQILEPGDSLYVERLNEHSFRNSGSGELELLWQTWYTGADIFIEECGIPRKAGEKQPGEIAFTPEQSSRWAEAKDWWVGPLASPNALHGINNSHATRRGEAFVVRREDGSSSWSPGEDMQGFITQKISPFNTAQQQFGIHWQYLHTGMQIPPHLHMRNEEMLFVMDGHGYAQFDDGEKVPIERGASVWVGRNVRHTMVAAPDTAMNIQFTITPPSLDVLFTDMGKPRKPGDPQADIFPIDESAFPALKQSWIPYEGQLD